MTLYTQEDGFVISPDMFQKDTAGDILVRFQSGIAKEKARNGIDIDELIGLALTRLKHYNSIVPSRENALAITKLEEAIHWLEHRKKDRATRGGTGTTQK